jgi:hypothetical protein
MHKPKFDDTAKRRKSKKPATTRKGLSAYQQRRTKKIPPALIGGYLFITAVWLALAAFMIFDPGFKL